MGNIDNLCFNLACLCLHFPYLEFHGIRQLNLAVDMFKIRKYESCMTIPIGRRFASNALNGQLFVCITVKI